MGKEQGDMETEVVLRLDQWLAWGIQGLGLIPGYARLSLKRRVHGSTPSALVSLIFPGVSSPQGRRNVNIGCDYVLTCCHLFT